VVLQFERLKSFELAFAPLANGVPCESAFMQASCARLEESHRYRVDAMLVGIPRTKLI
jgi:hypothetical protein